MARKKRMEEMSWVEFEECSKVFDTILLPMGSVEQEGPHLPLAVDSIVAWEVAGRAGEGCDALVGPLISVGYSDWHAAFPDTLSLSMETLTQVLREIMFALVEHGFKRFICINPHIGNEAPIFSIAREL